MAYVIRRFEAVLGLTLVALAVALGAAAAGDGTLPGDRWALRTAQEHLPGWIEPALDATNWFGYVQLVTPVALGIAAITVLWGRRAEALAVAISPVVWAFHGALRTVLQSPRPSEEFVRQAEQADSWGHPSGHVLGLTVVTAMLAIAFASRLPNRGRVAAATAVVLVGVVTGLGRLHLGAHWPSDVLGGYLWAGAWVIVLTWIFRWAGVRWPERPPSV